jgi:hypothetical protein
VIANGGYIDNGPARAARSTTWRQITGRWRRSQPFRLPQQRIILWRGSHSDIRPGVSDARQLKDMMTVVLLRAQGASGRRGSAIGVPLAW